MLPLDAILFSCPLFLVPINILEPMRGGPTTSSAKNVWGDTGRSDRLGRLMDVRFSCGGPSKHRSPRRRCVAVRLWCTVGGGCRFWPLGIFRPSDGALEAS